MNKIEEIRQLIGEYSAKIMTENPSWVFNAKDATELAEKICQLDNPKAETES